MKKELIDEKTGIPYPLVGDYYLPWGNLPDDEPTRESFAIGIWGQRRLGYIKYHRRTEFNELLISGKMSDCLSGLNEEAEWMSFELIREMAAKDGLTE